MDVASVLEEYLADISALPSDVAFILEEIRAKDVRLVELQRRIQQRDDVLQKFVKTSGASTECPKESLFAPKIRADYEECVQVQSEKTRLATMGLYLVAKQVKALDQQFAELEASGVVFPPLEDQEDVFEVSPSPAPKTPRKSVSEGSRRVSRVLTGAAESTKTKASERRDEKADRSSAEAVKNERPASAQAAETAAPPTPAGDTESAVAAPAQASEGRVNVDINGTRVSLKRDHSASRHIPSGEDVDAFCYCKKPSVGTMIACDSDNCEIEWFHWECVGLTADPVGAWFCPQCREKDKRAKKE